MQNEPEQRVPLKQSDMAEINYTKWTFPSGLIAKGNAMNVPGRQQMKEFILLLLFFLIRTLSVSINFQLSINQKQNQ